jgi:hypothetical protein
MKVGGDMTFNYRTGLFRIWLVLTLLWVVIAVWAGLHGVR